MRSLTHVFTQSHLALARTGRLSLAGLAGAGLFSAGLALAQPVQLTPQRNVAPASSPKPADSETKTETDSEKPATPGATSAEPPRVPEKTGIEVQRLAAPDPSQVGLLDASQGSLGDDLWKSARRPAVESLIRQLPVATKSRAVFALERRLLLTTATVPAGQVGKPSLLALRVERLWQLGALDSAVQLGAMAPPEMNERPLHRIALDRMLLAGQRDVACNRARELTRLDDDAYWLKVSTFCRLAAGERERAQANVALGLLREQGADDPRFQALAAVLAGQKNVKVESLAQPTALHFAMLREAKLPLPADALAEAPPYLLPALASYEHATAEQRLAAAERAEALQVISAADLSRVYASLEFTDAQRQTIPATATGPRVQALLYQIGMQADLPPAVRAEAIRRALREARARDVLATSARVNAAALRGLQLAPSMMDAVPELVRGLIAAGEYDAARLWYGQIRALAMQPNEEAALTAALNLWPIMQILEPADHAWNETEADRWFDSLKSLEPAERSRRAAALFVLAEATGHAVPTERWETLYASGFGSVAGQPIPVAVWRNLLRATEAAAAGQAGKGEAVALALIALGSHGPALADPVTVATVVGALRRIGVSAEMLAIAAEAGLARGL